MTQMAYICTPKVRDLYAKVRHIYYINVRQSVGSKRSTPLWHKCGKNLFLRFILSTLNRERVRERERERESF